MDHPAAGASVLWYFAYGSNLDPGTFLGRRRMRPERSCVAVLHGWRLVFDLPVGGERAVANLLAVPGEQVVGVAYAISDEQARHLDRTEGVPRAYRREAVDLLTAEGEGFAGFTYVSPHRQPDRKPSRRYMGLLLRGARHHGLPEEWVRILRAFPLAFDERSAQLELFPAPGSSGRAKVRGPHGRST